MHAAVEIASIIIYLKNIPIFSHWNDHAINFYIERWTLHIALWPRPRFSANSKGACALCLRNSIVCFGCVTKVPGRCCMACRHEKEKHLKHFAQCRNGCFLCKMRLNITSVDKAVPFSIWVPLFLLGIYFVILQSHWIKLGRWGSETVQLNRTEPLMIKYREIIHVHVPIYEITY